MQRGHQKTPISREAGKPRSSSVFRKPDTGSSIKARMVSYANHVRRMQTSLEGCVK